MARRRKFELEAELKGARETKRGFDEIADAEKRAGREAEETGRKGGRLGGIFQKIKGDAGAMITSLLGLGVVLKLFNSMVEVMEKVRQLQRGIVEGGLSLQEVFLPLASQLGDTSQAGIERAVDIGSRFIGAVKRPETARELAIAVDIAFGLKGAQAERGIQIGRKLGALFESAGFGPEVYGPAFKAMTTAGAVGSEQEALGFIGKMIAAQQASVSQDPGKFFMGFQRGAAGALGEGVPVEDVIELYVQGVQTKADEMLAGRALRKLFEVVKKERTEKAFAKFGHPLAGLEVGERARVFERVWPGLTLEQQREVVEGTEKEIFGPMFSEVALRAGAKARPKIEAIRPEAMVRRATEFMATLLAQQWGIEFGQRAVEEEEARTEAPHKFGTDVAKFRAERRLLAGKVGPGEYLFEEVRKDEERRKIIMEALLAIDTPEALEKRERMKWWEGVPLWGFPESWLREALEQTIGFAKAADKELRYGAGGITVINNIGTQVNPGQPHPTSQPAATQLLEPGGAQ